MHLYKQKTSRFWWVQLYGPDGNAVYKSTKQTVKREAKKVAEDLAAEMRREASKETGLAQTFQDLLRRAANAARHLPAAPKFETWKLMFYLLWLVVVSGRVFSKTIVALSIPGEHLAGLPFRDLQTNTRSEPFLLLHTDQ